MFHDCTPKTVHQTALMFCRRRALVKGAMQHAWSNYVTYAFGHDELMPRSLRGKDPFGGLGATILDSLDTLWLMGMQAEYQQARDWVAKDLNFTRYGLACLHSWGALRWGEGTRERGGGGLRGARSRATEGRGGVVASGGMLYVRRTIYLVNF